MHVQGCRQQRKTLPIIFVSNSNFKSFEVVQNIKFRQCYAFEIIDHVSVLDNHQIQPTASPPTSGGYPVFVTYSLESVPDFTSKFTWEGASPHTGRVSLHNSDDVTHRGRGNP